MAFHTADMAAPAQTWRAVVPSDTVPMTPGCRGIYVGGEGNVVAVDRDGNAVAFTAVPAGTFMPISPARINATSTTATLIIALY